MKKFNYLLTALLIGVIMLGATSCSKDDDDENYTMANQDFVTRASSSNMFEITAGTLAVQQSSNTSVKAFGQHMIDDHGKAATEMQNLANNKGWTVPTSMLPEHQQKYDALKAMTGTAFDKQFAALMVSSHQETIALFGQAANENGVPDDDLRGFAEGKLPTLKHHLDEATQLKAQVDALP